MDVPSESTLDREENICHPLSRHETIFTRPVCRADASVHQLVFEPSNPANHAGQQIHGWDDTKRQPGKETVPITSPRPATGKYDANRGGAENAVDAFRGREKEDGGIFVTVDAQLETWTDHWTGVTRRPVDKSTAPYLRYQ